MPKHLHAEVRVTYVTEPTNEDGLEIQDAITAYLHNEAGFTYWDFDDSPAPRYVIDSAVNSGFGEQKTLNEIHEKHGMIKSISMIVPDEEGMSGSFSIYWSNNSNLADVREHASLYALDRQEELVKSLRIILEQTQ